MYHNNTIERTLLPGVPFYAVAPLNVQYTKLLKTKLKLITNNIINLFFIEKISSRISKFHIHIDFGSSKLSALFEGTRVV